MSVPTLDGSAFVSQSATEEFADAKAESAAEKGADAALTARAVVAVTVLGAAFWYVLWKLALHFLAER